MESIGRKNEAMPNLPAELDEFRKEYDSACMNLPTDIINIMGAFHKVETLFEESRNRELSAEELNHLKGYMYFVTRTAEDLALKNHTKR